MASKCLSCVLMEKEGKELGGSGPCTCHEKANGNVVRFRIRGREFASTAATLNQCPWLACLLITCDGKPLRPSATEGLGLNVDPEAFEVVLRFLRTGMLIVPQGMPVDTLRAIAKRFHLKPLTRAIKLQQHLNRFEHCRSDEVVHLNVRGRRFSSTRRTLAADHWGKAGCRNHERDQTRLAAMFRDEEEPVEWNDAGEAILDCDPTCFDIILRYLRSGVILPPDNFGNTTLLLLEVEKFRLFGMLEFGTRPGGLFCPLVHRVMAAGSYKSLDFMGFEREQPGNEAAAGRSAAAARAVTGAAWPQWRARSASVPNAVVAAMRLKRGPTRRAKSGVGVGAGAGAGADGEEGRGDGGKEGTGRNKDGENSGEGAANEGGEGAADEGGEGAVDEGGDGEVGEGGAGAGVGEGDEGFGGGGSSGGGSGGERGGESGVFSKLMETVADILRSPTRAPFAF